MDPSAQDTYALRMASSEPLRRNLTPTKVVAVRDVETNKYPHALWHLATESNSVPIRDFMYGMAIKGLHPALKGAQPEPLEPGVKYRLYVEAGSFRTEHDFVPDPRTP